MKEIPKWQKYLAVVVLIVCAASIATWWTRFFSDFWPPDRSFVGPNLVASVVQWAIVLMALALFYPPVRIALDHYVKRHVADLKAHVSAEHAAVHEKLDHVIKHHPSIPEFKPKEKP